MDHIIPVLIRLHWLPVEYQSQCKLFLYPSQHHFSRYLPPEQRPMVTAVSTRLRQLCGTTYHSSSKLCTRYQLLNRV
jgi:hypothetical protein